MAATSLSLVNQKLAFCRALVKLIQQEPEPRQVSARVRCQSLLDAAAFHLLCAYRHYLREVAENYGVADSANISSEEALAGALQRMDKSPSEACELEALRNDPDSWLVELQSAYEACWELSDPVAMSQRIQVMDLDAPRDRSRKVSRERLLFWFEAFEHLVDRQRETSAEY